MQIKDDWTEINRYSTQTEVDNMTPAQAIEILQYSISQDYEGNGWRPRKHMVKAWKMAVDSLRLQTEDDDEE